MTRVLLLLWLPQLYVALQLGPATRGCQSRSSVSMRANAAGVDVSSAAREIIEHFLAATERGDAAAATEVCSEDLLYKTHRSTTESLAAAQERLHTKVLRGRGCARSAQPKTTWVATPWQNSFTAWQELGERV